MYTFDVLDFQLREYICVDIQNIYIKRIYIIYIKRIYICVCVLIICINLLHHECFDGKP